MKLTHHWVYRNLKTKSFIKEKNKIAKYYYQKLNNNKILLPKYLNHRVTSWHLFIIRFNLKMMKKIKVI